MATGFCPECDSDINLGRAPRKGQLVTCESCGAYLVVTGESPIELDWAGDEEEEDYSLEDEEEEDDLDF